MKLKIIFISTLILAFQSCESVPEEQKPEPSSIVATDENTKELKEMAETITNLYGG